MSNEEIDNTLKWLEEEKHWSQPLLTRMVKILNSVDTEQHYTTTCPPCFLQQIEKLKKILYEKKKAIQ